MCIRARADVRGVWRKGRKQATDLTAFLDLNMPAQPCLAGTLLCSSAPQWRSPVASRRATHRARRTQVGRLPHSQTRRWFVCPRSLPGSLRAARHHAQHHADAELVLCLTCRARGPAYTQCHGACRARVHTRAKLVTFCKCTPCAYPLGFRTPLPVRVRGYGVHKSGTHA